MKAKIFNLTIMIKLIRNFSFLLVFTTLLTGHASVDCSQNETPCAVEAIDGKLFLIGQYNKTYKQEWAAVKNETELLSSSQEKFNPQNFRFLVHALSGDLERVEANPQFMTDQISFSASLIDQDHRTTWRWHGFILSVPPENILASGSGDLGSPRMASIPVSQSKEWLSGLDLMMRLFTINKYRVSSPVEILSHSQTDRLNEVYVAGQTPNGGKVKIAGVFFQVRNGEVMSSKKEYEILTRVAAKLAVPVVFIDYQLK